MRKLLIILSFTSWSVFSIAQSTSDCNGAIVLCADVYEEENASLNTGNIYEWTGACNASLEQSSVWYTFTIQQAGDLSFVITPNNPNDDYDWGLFNITVGGCQGINLQDGSSPEVSCNSYGVIGVNGPTGISTSQGGISNSGGPGNFNGPPFNADLPVTEGQVFALVVMNWSNSFDGYSIDFSESTASLFDDVAPQLVAAEVNCSNTQFLLTFSENIMMSSVVDSDFLIEGPDGTTYEVGNAHASSENATADANIILELANSITEPGIYTIVITEENGYVEDACGNLAVNSIEVELFPPITFEYETTPDCNNGSGVIQVTEISGGIEPYIVSLNGSFQPQNTFSGLSAGVYELYISDSVGCDFTQEIELIENPLTVFIPLQDSIPCNNPNTTIEGVQIFPSQTVAYEWITVLGPGSVVSGGNTVSPAVSGPGLYQINVTNTQLECTASAQVFIFLSEENPLSYEIEVSHACNGQNGSALFSNLSGGQPPYTIWVGGNMAENNEVSGLSSGTQTLQISDNGFCVLLGEVEIPNHNIGVFVSPVQDTLSCTSPLVSIGGVEVESSTPVQYNWTTTNGVITTGIETATPVVSEEGYYTVTVTDVEHNCSASAGVFVTAVETNSLDLSTLVAPNVVTPNSDGKNDVWYPYITSDPLLDLDKVLEVLKLKVYNRWGNLVHESNGTAKWVVSEFPEGTYYFVLNYETQCGKAQKGDKSGVITVLR